MNWTLERVTDPDIEPVSLDEMKKHLRIDEPTILDDTVRELTKAAREWAEDFTGRALIDQTWRLTTDAAAELLLRRSPVIEITAVRSVVGGVATDQDIAGVTLLEKDSKWPRVTTALTGVLQIEFRAGFADRSLNTDIPPVPSQDASVVPMRFKQAIKLYAEALYDHDQFMLALLLRTAHDVIRPEAANLQIG